MEKLFTTISLFLCLIAVNLPANPTGTQMQLDSMVMNLQISIMEFPMMKMAYYYNTNKKVKKSVISPLMDMGMFTKTTTIYDYDGNNKIIRETNLDSSDTPISKEEYSYGSSGKITEKTYYTYDNPNWSSTSKETLTYEGGKLVLIISYSAYNDQFLYRSQTEYKYENNKLTEELTYIKAVDDEELILNEKKLYTYNTKGLLTQDEIHMLTTNDIGEDVWYINSKEEYSYDTYDNISIQKTYEFNEETSELILTQEQTMTYNNDYTLEDLILPTTADDEDLEVNRFNHMPITMSMSMNQDGQEMIINSELFYSPFNPSAIDEHSLSANIFPNPAKENITFNWDNADNFMNLQIIDINGNIILTKKLTKGASVNLDRLNNGNYIYYLTSGKNILQGKFIKE